MASEQISEVNVAATEDSTPVPTTETENATEQLHESKVSAVEWGAMQDILNTIYAYRTADGHDPSKVFHRKVNKRAIPTYYEVIKEPVALSVIKAKINAKEYKDFAEFVRDFALISHNAQLYNRPDAGAYQDALEIKKVVEAELQKLVTAEIVTEEVTKAPFLGEIPPPDELPNEDAEEEEEEEDDDEDDDEEGDESDDSRSKPRGRGRPKGSTKKLKEDKDEQRLADLEAKKRRGRPPRVDTPLEARLKNILKGMRRFKNPAGQLKVSHFDRLPDKVLMPEYFTEIKNPMAVDVVKKKLKRKKYQSIEQFMKDIELVFENAKIYNQDESQIYKDAVDLQLETRILAEQEKQKPDSEFVMEDGRLPMPNGILHNGELYKVGDWVHIQNPNDLTKPIPSQIYRTWQDSDGRKWINACWYYRPEQTVHRFDRHFFENEIVKTGQYRDHQIDEIVDRCFVMFITRYNKGRPRGFPSDKEIYVCEARYNEEKHKLNKIKTWASCLPDEVRDKDYEMDLFEGPRKMKKFPSPIAYLLKDDAKETDDLPKPEWGAENAPPKIGAVHKRPREAKDSPPPEPTPTPPPQPPPPPPRAPTTIPAPSPNAYTDQANGHMPLPSPQPILAPSQDATAQAIASLKAQQEAQRNSYQQSISPAPTSRHIVNTRPPFTSHTPQVTYPSRDPHHIPNNYTPAPPPPRYPQPVQTATAAVNYKAPPPTEVWHLGDTANAQIPPEIREQFQCDKEGRVLFFTSPPLDIRTESNDGFPLSHSARYLAAKAEWNARLAEKRKRDEEEQDEMYLRNQKKRQEEEELFRDKLASTTARALSALEEQLVTSTRADYQVMHGESWEKYMKEDLTRAENGQVDT